SRLRNCFDSDEREGGIGPGTFIWTAQQAGWSRPQPTPEEKYGPAEQYREKPATDQSAQGTEETAKQPSRFRNYAFKKYRTIPEKEFWDAAKTLPKMPGGAVAIIYGEFGSHKTNTVLTVVLDAVLERGARAIYAAGEGAYGLGKDRIPAHCKARGIEVEALDDRLHGVDEVPLFASPEQVNEFIAEQKAFKPNIVVLDTFSKAIAGEDENGSRAAQF